MFENLCRDPARFRFRVERLVITHSSTLRIRRPEIFSLALEIVFHHRAGDVENRLRRTIVLFEPDGLRAWEMLFEVKNVADVGAAPLVDRLIFVADDTDVLLFLREKTDERELQ